MIQIERTGDWKKLESLLDPNIFAREVLESIQELLGDSADTIVRQQREKIKSGELPANAPYTIMLKGQNSPLIDTGALLASIQSVKMGDDFVAGPQGSHYSGMTASELAVKHEMGGFFLIGNTVHFVPARKFAQEPIDEEMERLPDELIEKIAGVFDSM